jgi:hypothetical protein
MMPTSHVHRHEASPIRIEFLILETATNQFAGIVMMGTCGTAPVSAIEVNIIKKVKTRLDTRSRSSIQNQ